MLLTEGLITQAQLDAALKAQAERGLPIGQLLVEDGAVTDAVLMGALARQLGLEFVDLAEYPIDRGAVGAPPRGHGPPPPGPPGHLGRGRAWWWPWPTPATSWPSTTSGP